MAEDRMFVEALEAIRAGNNARARDLLTRLLQTNKDNENYWLYMSSVVESHKEQVFCLENVLRINPKNEAAKRGMIMVGARPAEGAIKPVRPKLGREWDIGDVYGMRASSWRDRVNIPTNRLVGFGALGLLFIVLVAFGIYGFGNQGSGRSRVAGPGSSFETPTPTGQATLVPTPVGGGPMFPVLDGPTPLSKFLEATYTPTPYYIESDHISEAFSAGLRSLGKGDYEQAIEFLTQFLEAEPGTVDAIYYLGEAYLGLGNNLRAKERFTQALNFDDTFAPAYVGRAKANLGLLQPGTVTDDLGKAIAHDPDYIESYLVRAKYFFSRGTAESLELALEDANSALEIDESSAQAYHILAKVYLKQRNYEDALEAAQRTYELDITIVDNYIVLGQALIENDFIAEAKASLETYLAFNDPDALTWLLLGRTQQAVGEHEVALESFKKSAELDQNLYERSYYRGFSYLAIEDYDNAINRLSNAARIFPEWFEPHLYHGVAVLQKAISEEKNAGEGYNLIQASNSYAKSDEQLALLYYWRALGAEAINRYDLAETDWEALIELPNQAVPEGFKSTAREHLAGPTATPDPSIPTRLPTQGPSPTATP